MPRGRLVMCKDLKIRCTSEGKQRRAEITMQYGVKMTRTSRDVWKEIAMWNLYKSSPREKEAT